MLPTNFLKQDNNLLYLAGIKSIPAKYTQKVNQNVWPYVVAYHFGLDPDAVKGWDNDSILEALASLKIMGVIK